MVYYLRDPKPFERILVYLRTDKMMEFFDQPGFTEDEVLEEANYFGYADLAAMITREKKKRRDEKCITINVGGTLVTSTLGTFCRCSNYSGKESGGKG